MMNWRFVFSPSLVAGVALMISVFLLEIFSGIMLGTVFYIPIGLFILWLCRSEKHIVILGICTSALIVAGYFLRTHEIMSLSSIRLNRVVTFLTIWLAVYSAIRYRRTVANQEKLVEQLQALFQHATESILFLNKDGDIVLANPYASRIFGYEPQEIKGRHISSLFPGVDMKCFQPGVVTDVKGDVRELNAQNSKGMEFPAEISLASYDSGKTKMFILFVQDATNRKERERLTVEKVTMIAEQKAALEEEVSTRTRELHSALDNVRKANLDLVAEVKSREAAEIELMKSQKLYREIAENFPDGMIAVLDKQFCYVFADGEEFLDVGIKDKQIIGRSFMKGVPAEYITDCTNNLRKAFAGVRSKLDITRNDRFYSVTCVPLYSATGQVEEALVVVRNITSRKKVENDLLLNLEKERTLNMLKSRFVTAASHEFRTPLTTIQSSASILLNYTGSQLEAKKETHVKRIKDAVHALTEHLNDFLCLSKIEEGKVVAVNSMFNLKEMLLQLMELETVKTEAQKIALHYDIGSSNFISTDREMLKIIVANLLSNAVKYSPPRATIELNVYKDRSNLVIEIEDHGIGIPQSEQRHVFQQFFRGQNAVDITGTGLGLNIVKKYTDLLRGTITFSSVENVATKFQVVVPLQ